MDNIVHNLIYGLFEEVIAHGDNNPTKLSLLLYCYFQMFYNIGCLFTKNASLTVDRVSIPPWYNELYNQVLYLTNKSELLQNFLYYGHNGFLSSLYNDFNKNKYKITDFGIKDIKLLPSIQLRIFNWGSQHIIGKTSEIEKTGITKNNDTGMPADITGKPEYTSVNPDKWVNLIVPNGSYTENGIPIIDINASSTYNIQKFIGNQFWQNRGFSINPSVENILDVSYKLSLSWEEGLKEQTEKLLKTYQNLDDRKKMISELFSGTNLSLPGFWVIIGMMLSLKNNQSLENDIIMFFILSCGLYDSSIAAWTYKSKYELPRPISMIRHYFKDQLLDSWNPEGKNKILGANWLPYQSLTSVSPPYPDGISSHTVFSVVSGKLLEWWFSSSNLNNTFKLFSISNPHLISSCLNNQYKTFSCGEFCIERGSSQIEPNTTPNQTFILKFNTVKELYEEIANSRLYSGVSLPETIDISNQLANWVYDKVRGKFETIFKIKSPY